ncbi:hypothetical protein BC831DRAFT_458944 [Entophlyctis helioformis]|nr:hypothetical protein BC831DRAFT_458944 [Entophlyctis helioformis]
MDHAGSHADDEGTPGPLPDLSARPRSRPRSQSFSGTATPSDDASAATKVTHVAIDGTHVVSPSSPAVGAPGAGSATVRGSRSFFNKGLNGSSLFGSLLKPTPSNASIASNAGSPSSTAPVSPASRSSTLPRRSPVPAPLQTAYPTGAPSMVLLEPPSTPFRSVSPALSLSNSPQPGPLHDLDLRSRPHQLAAQTPTEPQSPDEAASASAYAAASDAPPTALSRAETLADLADLADDASACQDGVAASAAPLAPPLPTSEQLMALKPPAITGVFKGVVREIHAATGTKLASAERNDEFHKLFAGLVPDDERLVTDFVCALNVGVLVDGKLWVSEHHLIFRGWAGKPIVVIDFTSITHIEKSKFANLLPNAIEVETDQGKYFFGTIFPPRNPKYDLMVKLWNTHVDSKSLFRKKPNLAGLSCHCGSEFLAEGESCDLCEKKHTIKKAESIPDFYQLRRNDSAASRPASMRGLNRSTSAVQHAHLHAHGIHSPHLIDESSSGHTSHSRRDSMDSQSTSMTSSGDESCLRESSTPAPSSLHSIDYPSSEVNCPCCENSERSLSEDGFTLVLDTVLPLSMERLWADWSCIRENGSLYSRYLPEKMHFRELQFGPWVRDDDAKSDLLPVNAISDFSQYNTDLRDIKAGFHRRTQYIVPLSAPMGPKQTRSKNNESILYHKLGHFLCQENHNESPDVNVPMFNIGRTCFTFVSPSETRVRVHWKVVFTRGYFAKTIASSIAIESMKSFYSGFAQFIRSNATASPASLSTTAKPPSLSSGVKMPSSDASILTVKAAQSTTVTSVSATAQDKDGSSTFTTTTTSASASITASLSSSSQAISALTDLVRPLFNMLMPSSQTATPASGTPSPMTSSPYALLLLIFLFVIVMLNTLTLLHVVRVLDRTEMQLHVMQKNHLVMVEAALRAAADSATAS